MHNILAPTISPNDEEVKITKINYRQNFFVNKGDVILELESTKVAFDLQSEHEGYFYSYFKEGDTVECGKIIGVISKKKIKEENLKDSNLVRITKKAELLLKKNNLDIKIFKDKQLITELDVSKLLNKNFKKEINVKLNHNDIIIVGAGSHGKVIYDAITSNSLKVACFIDYSSNFENTNLYDLPIFNLDSLKELKEKGAKKIYINTNNLDLTKKIYNMCKSYGYEFPPVIHSSAQISKNVKLGDNSFIGPNVILGPDVEIGKFTKILNSSTVAHDSKIGDFSQISDGSSIAGNVNIGNNTLIGIKVGIVNKVIIKNNVTITSGKTIIRNVEDGEVIRFS